MSIYLDLAKKYINTEIGTDFAIVPEGINDLEDFFSFTYQTKEFLETGNFSAMTIGQGYHFIHKKDQRIFPYGSRLSFEEAMNDLREKLAIEVRIKTHKVNFELDVRYNIQINQIRNKQLVIDLFIKHRLEYIIPEVVGDSIFRISKPYKKNELLLRLDNLPTTFSEIQGHDMSYLIDDLLKSACCDFDLILHIPVKYEVYTSRATPGDLNPIW